jgi:hypothetical protein
MDINGSFFTNRYAFKQISGLIGFYTRHFFFVTTQQDRCPAKKIPFSAINRPELLKISRNYVRY